MQISLIDRLVTAWHLADVRPKNAATGDAIATFEERFSRTLPRDLRTIYERFNGLHDTDADLNRFWPIDEIDTVPSVIDPYAGTSDFSGIAQRLPLANEYFAFADHSIWVYVYAVRLTDDEPTSGPVVWIADGDTFDIVSDTFSGFWDRYLATSERILVP